jgi:hypothetical protein
VTDTASIEIPIGSSELHPDLDRDWSSDELPAPTVTALDRIKAQIAADKDKDARKVSFRLPVLQRPYLVIEYGPIVAATWNGLQAKALETGMSDVDMQARGLALFVRGVYLRADDDSLISADLNDPAKPAPKFDERLATSLGIPWGGVQYEFIKTLYVLDGELASTALALLTLSGFGKAAEVVASAEGK